MHRCLLLLFAVLAPSSAAEPSNIGKFWHVSDFHFDHTYWTSQLSCNADVPNPNQLGDYWCDSPWKLVTAAIQAMKTHGEDADFIVWTGDTVAHIKDKYLNVSLNMELVDKVTQELLSAFPTKPLFPAFGNHDYWPSDQFPADNSYIYNRTAEIWHNWITDAQQVENFRKGGYHTGTSPHGLRVLALNTNLYYTANEENTNVTDPAGQLQWMRTVLQDARTRGHKVVVLAHIPPGVHTPTRTMWFHPEFVQPVDQVLKDFADVIVGMHFGHEHHDGFKVFYDNDGQASVPFFVAPSVTPWRYKLPNGDTGPAHNPGIRLVTYDRQTGKHLDIEQLHMDLPKAIASGVANFTRLYSFTEHYKVPDVSATSLEKLVKRMHTGSEGRQLLDDYYHFTTVGARTADRTCDSTCRNRFLCGFRHYTFETFDKCVDDLVSAAPMTSATPLLALLTAMTSLRFFL